MKTKNNMFGMAPLNKVSRHESKKFPVQIAFFRWKNHYCIRVHCCEHTHPPLRHSMDSNFGFYAWTILIQTSLIWLLYSLCSSIMIWMLNATFSLLDSILFKFVVGSNVHVFTECRTKKEESVYFMPNCIAGKKCYWSELLNGIVGVHVRVRCTKTIRKVINSKHSNIICAMATYKALQTNWTHWCYLASMCGTN